MVKKIIGSILLFANVISLFFIIPLIKKQNNDNFANIDNVTFHFSNQKLSAEEKTAFHEAGHAIIALNYHHSCRVNEISIIPSKNIAGYTNLTFYNTNPEIKIATLLGGTTIESLLANNNKINIKEVGDGSNSDNNQIKNSLNTITKDKKKQRLILNQMFKQNAMILYLQQNFLKTLVGNLIHKKKLKQKEIKTLYEQFLNNESIMFQDKDLDYNFNCDIQQIHFLIKQLRHNYN